NTNSSPPKTSSATRSITRNRRPANMAPRILQPPASAIPISLQNPAPGQTGDHDPAVFSPAVATPDVVVPDAVPTLRPARNVFVPPGGRLRASRQAQRFRHRPIPRLAPAQYLPSRVNWTVF